MMRGMPDGDRHGRQSIRLREADYSAHRASFVTIMTRLRRPSLATLESGEMVLTEAGRIVMQTWVGLPSKYPQVVLDEFVIMPDHLHAVLWLKPTGTDHPVPLGRVIKTLKGAASFLIRKETDPEFAWERNYYERILRTAETETVRVYIRQNPGVLLTAPQSATSSDVHDPSSNKPRYWRTCCWKGLRPWTP